jgi:hypothetical protein
MGNFKKELKELNADLEFMYKKAVQQTEQIKELRKLIRETF